MKTPEELAREYCDKKFGSYAIKYGYNTEFTMHPCYEAFLSGYAAAMERRGIVANAMRRQGLDPGKAKSNNAELAVISGKRFEEDL